jgi:hypothetical protein
MMPTKSQSPFESQSTIRGRKCSRISPRYKLESKVANTHCRRCVSLQASDGPRPSKWIGPGGTSDAIGLCVKSTLTRECARTIPPPAEREAPIERAHSNNPRRQWQWRSPTAPASRSSRASFTRRRRRGPSPPAHASPPPRRRSPYRRPRRRSRCTRPRSTPPARPEASPAAGSPTCSSPRSTSSSATCRWVDNWVVLDYVFFFENCFWVMGPSIGSLKFISRS